MSTKNYSELPLDSEQLQGKEGMVHNLPGMYNFQAKKKLYREPQAMI